MIGRLASRVTSWIDATLAALGEGFLRHWCRIERGYRRPFSAVALRLKFAFYPLLALAACGWLAWDWTHARSLNSAEDAIFDRVVRWRPMEPRPSGRVAVVEIDDCSIEYFRARGEGGWPWSRQRHADLLDQLDRAGVSAVAYDVLFADASTSDPLGDESLEAMALGGAGRFLFGSTRLHPDYDAGSSIRASRVPGAFPLKRPAVVDPTVALLVPYGASMSTNSAIMNVTRNVDGVLRDIPLRVESGDWVLPSLPLRLATTVTSRAAEDYPASVRPNWRRHTRLPQLSAADVLTGGRSTCRETTNGPPSLKGAVALVGYTASGLNDAKPTPVDPVMPGVEALGEATEALVAGSWIRTPPAWLKYVIATLLSLLTTLAFFRGEPANDIDSIFVATNLVLLGAAIVGLTFFGFFFDIFASVAFISLVFGLCRMYAGVQRGRAVGNADFLPEYDPGRYPWLAIVRLRFVPDVEHRGRSAARRSREYRRRLRRFLYSGSDAVMLEGVVERKSWLHDALSDLMVLVWHGETEAAARSVAMRDLARLERELARQDRRLPDDGTVRMAFACAEVDDTVEGCDGGATQHLRDFVGAVLASSVEWPLARREALAARSDIPSGGS